MLQLSALVLSTLVFEGLNLGCRVCFAAPPLLCSAHPNLVNRALPKCGFLVLLSGYRALAESRSYLLAFNCSKSLTMWLLGALWCDLDMPRLYGAGECFKVIVLPHCSRVVWVHFGHHSSFGFRLPKSGSCHNAVHVFGTVDDINPALPYGP